MHRFRIAALLLPLALLPGCHRGYKAPVLPPALAAKLTPHPTPHCTSAAGLPDPACTPGALRAVASADLCKPIDPEQARPPLLFTYDMKKQQLTEYGYTDKNLADYEVDVLIPLSLGGDATNAQNLWPMARTGFFNSFQKAQVEDWLHREVCSGKMPLGEAQHGVATNWKQYLGVATTGAPLDSGVPPE